MPSDVHLAGSSHPPNLPLTPLPSPLPPGVSPLPFRRHVRRGDAVRSRAEQSDVQGGLPRGRRRPPRGDVRPPQETPRSYSRLRTRRRARVRCSERPRRRRRAPRPSHGLPLRGRLRAGHPLLPHVPRRGSRLRPARPRRPPHPRPPRRGLRRDGRHPRRVTPRRSRRGRSLPIRPPG